jgi:hypothetical protein
MRRDNNIRSEECVQSRMWNGWWFGIKKDRTWGLWVHGEAESLRRKWRRIENVPGCMSMSQYQQVPVAGSSLPLLTPRSM